MNELLLMKSCHVLLSSLSLSSLSLLSLFSSLSSLFSLSLWLFLWVLLTSRAGLLRSLLYFWLSSLSKTFSWLMLPSTVLSAGWKAATGVVDTVLANNWFHDWHHFSLIGLFLFVEVEQLPFLPYCQSVQHSLKVWEFMKKLSALPQWWGGFRLCNCCWTP